MSSISSPGIGSGLDVNAIVSQLVAAERAGPDAQIASQRSAAQTQISALGALRSALSSLQTAAQSLIPGNSQASTASRLGALSATSSNTDLFSATANSNAVAGNYNVEVLALASANKIATSTYTNSLSVVGNGDVTLTSGGRSFTVSLSNGQNTLADLRNKINSASDNTGVGATIVTDSNGARLLLTAQSTGLSNAVSVSTSLFTTSTVQAASDARINVDGFSITSATNQVSGAVDGITFNLAKAQPGTTAQLSVAVDQSSSVSAVQTFVNSYNSVVRFINAQTAYNAGTKQAGTLLGDAAARSASQQLRSIVGGSVSGNGTFTTLSQIGVTTNVDGTLQFDSASLNTALNNDPNAVQRLFGGPQGVATRLDSAIDTLTDTSGAISAETDGLNARLTDLGKSQDSLNRRISDFEARQRAQFTALDTLLGQLNSTSTYLTQQLARLANP